MAWSGEDRRECKSSQDCPHAESAADAAVKKVFAILGVDIDKPEQVEAFREDLRFGGMLRRAASRGALAFFGAVGVALAAALWAGITSKVGVPH